MLGSWPSSTGGVSPRTYGCFVIPDNFPTFFPLLDHFAGINMFLPNWGAFSIGRGRPHIRASMLMRETCQRRAQRDRLHVAAGQLLFRRALPDAALPGFLVRHSLGLSHAFGMIICAAPDCGSYLTGHKFEWSKVMKLASRPSLLAVNAPRFSSAFLAHPRPEAPSRMAALLGMRINVQETTQ